MKLICKCGNIEDLTKHKILENFKIRDCEDGTIAVVCKKCNELIFINLKN